jgi:hypothetical protein
MMPRLMTIGITMSLISIFEEYRQFALIERSTEFMDAVYSIAGVWVGITLVMVPLLVMHKINPLYYFRERFFRLIGLCVLFIPILLGLLIIDETPKQHIAQEDEASSTVFKHTEQSKKLDNSTPQKTGSLKSEIYEIAFSNDTIQTFGSNKESATADEILATYEKYFKKLQFYASIKSDQLFNQAMEDYRGRKEDDSFSIFNYLKEYKNSGIGLADEIDQLFDAIYQKLEVQLEENGHKPELAEPFLEQYKKERRERVTAILKFLKEELL